MATSTRPAAAGTLAWFREIGTVTPTRHADTHIWHQGPGLWRILQTDSAGHTDYRLPIYKTRAEALSQVEIVHAQWVGDDAALQAICTCGTCPVHGDTSTGQCPSCERTGRPNATGPTSFVPGTACPFCGHVEVDANGDTPKGWS